jgi:hypothetical protein
LNWRIYRLPGSREIWHIDAGPDTQVYNVRSYSCAADSESVDIGGDNVPRAWISVLHAELHIVNGKALFVNADVADAISVTEKIVTGDFRKCAAVPE